MEREDDLGMELKVLNDTLQRRLSVPNKFKINFSKGNNSIRKSSENLQLFSNKLSHDHLIKKCSTTSEAIKWISSTSESNVGISKELTYISLIIGEKIDKSLFDNLLKEFFGIEFSILISIKSSAVDHETLFFWRNLGKKVFHYLEINNDSNGIVTQFCQKFLLNEIASFKSGILNSFKSKQKLQLHEIGDENNNNLLIIATKESKHEVVKKLLEYRFDVDFENNENLTAIEYTWICYKNAQTIEDQLQHNEIILNLLHSNSRYPRNIEVEFEMASPEVQNFIDYCESIHMDVDNGKTEEIRSKIQQYPHLFYFYNKYNESIVAHTLTFQKLEIYRLLQKLNLTWGDHEDLEEIYDERDETYGRLIRDENKLCAKLQPKRYLSILVSKSKIGSNDRESDTKWKHIKEAFRIIDQNETCSKILKVISLWKKSEIIFDFKQDSVLYLDPTKSKYTQGAVYNSGVIYIGAKKLTDDDKKYEVIGVIIHELCHLAVLITFMNNFDPYPIGDSKAKELFREAFRESEKNQIHSNIVENVFKNYIDDYKHSELIVIVVQMMMHYYVRDPNIECENSTKMKELESKFSLLFSYFKTVVEPELDEIMCILERLQDEKSDLKFEDLTEPMKSKILHSKINFQGENSTLFDIIENDSDILKHLTSKSIQDILLLNKAFVLNNICKLTTKYKVMERRFVNFDTELWCGSDLIYAEETENYESIINLIEKSKIFILSDNAGAGKTTTLEHLTQKLKSHYPSYWVSLIHLRNCRDILDKYKNKPFNNDGIFDLLNKLLKLKTKIEQLIFKKLFLNQRVILLFDGVDEISPRFNEFIMEIFHELGKTSQNQLWISTRPQHVQKLKDDFKSSAYKLVPYCWEEKKDFIIDVLCAFDIKSSTEQEEALREFHEFFKTVENREAIDNPLMIKIITELYAEKKISLKSESFNLYDTFEKIIKTQKVLFYSKVENKEHIDHLDKVSVSLDDIHQKYALEIILFEENQNKYDLKYDELTFIQNWNEREKRHSQRINLEEIQRYGILTITLKDNQLNIDFIHRTYPEFFVAQYLASIIYHDTKCKEFYKILNFLLFSLNQYEELKTVREFLWCRIKQEKKYFLDKRVSTFVSKMSNKIRNQVVKYLRPQCIELSSLLLSSSNEIEKLKNLWLIDSESNLLKQILSKIKLKTEDFRSMMECLNLCFGDDWHQKFSTKNLLKSQYIQDFNIKKGYNEFNKNLLKILDLIDKNFSKNEKSKTLNNFVEVIVLEYFENVHINIFEKIYTTFNYQITNVLYILINQLKLNHNSEPIAHKWIEVFTLECFDKEIEKISIKDKEMLKPLLFLQQNYKTNILFVALTSNKKGVFKKVVKLYNWLMNSYDELQQIFLIDLQISTIFLNINFVHFEDFVEFIKDIFESNRNVLVDSMKHEKDKDNLIQNFSQFELFKKFLFSFLRHDKKHVDSVITNYLFQLNYANILLDSIKNNEANKFRQIIKICLEFNKSSCEGLQNLFINQQKLHEYFLHISVPLFEEFREFMSKIFSSNKMSIFNCISKSCENNLKLVLNENKFEIFEHFMFYIFNDNKNEAVEFINRFLSNCLVKDEHPLLNSIKIKDIEIFQKLKKVFDNYKTKTFYEELQETFTSRNVILDLILVSNDFGAVIMELLKEVFNTNKKLLQIHLEDWVFRKEIDVLLNEKYFRFFEKIYIYLFDDNLSEAIINLKSLLIFNEKTVIETLIFSLRKNNYRNIIWVSNLLTILNFSNDVLQFIFISMKNVLESFNSLPVKCLDNLIECLVNAFSSNKSLILDCIESDSKLVSELILNENRFKRFENFLITLYNNEESEVKNIIKNLLFRQFSSKSHPLNKAMKSDDICTFNRITNLYFNYCESLNDIQEILISNHEVFDIYSQMTEEMQKSIVIFLKKVFNENKLKFTVHFCNLPKRKLVNIIIDKNLFGHFKNFLSEIIFEDKENNLKTLKIGLFKNDLPLLRAALQSEHLETFQWIKSYFTTFKSLKEIQNVFIHEKIFPEVFFYISDEIFYELLSFTKEIFKSEKYKIIDCFQDCCNEHFKLFIHSLMIERFEEFVVKIYDGNEHEVNTIIRKYLYFNYSSIFHPLLIAIRSNKITKFKIITNLYFKYGMLMDDFSKFLPSDENSVEYLESFEDISEEIIDFLEEKFVNIMTEHNIKIKGCDAIFETNQLNNLRYVLNKILKNENKIGEILDRVFDNYFFNREFIEHVQDTDF